MFVKDIQSFQVNWNVRAAKSSLFVKASGRFVTLHLIFLKLTFQSFISMGNQEL